jgi:gentisate 1,2-dioxygenase
MSETLGSLEDLPADYRAALEQHGLAPLWPNLRALLPPGAPRPTTEAGHWPYVSLRPLLMQAGELTPVEKAERRVLVLSDPGRGSGAMQATSTLYLGMQLLLPGETAPAHVHTPSAVRLVVEGSGGYTVVRGEKLPMEEGDVVLTPGGLWHDHGHEGEDPVVWLDILDLPLFVYLEGAYANPGPLQAPQPRVDPSQAEYATPGLVPSRANAERLTSYPQLRFPWVRVEAALRQLARATGGAVEMDYVDPETGQDVLPTLGLTAMFLPAGSTLAPPRRSTSAAYHVVRGCGTSTIGSKELCWTDKDSFSAPVFARTTHLSQSDAFLVRIEDRPLQQKLGYYEERTR